MLKIIKPAYPTYSNNFWGVLFIIINTFSKVSRYLLIYRDVCFFKCIIR